MRRWKRGFTAIELIAVTGIIVMLVGVVLIGNQSFSRTVLLSNTGYDVALTIRNAQVYGIASRAAGTRRNAGYGVEFNIATPQSFLLFPDIDPTVTGSPNLRPGDGHYTLNLDSPAQTYTLTRGVTVSKFCAMGATTYCTTDAINPIQKLDVVYARPNTFASTSVYVSGASPQWVWQGLTRACITLQSPQGDTRHILMTLIGQVTTATSCP